MQGQYPGKKVVATSQRLFVIDLCEGGVKNIFNKLVPYLNPGFTIAFLS